MKTSIDKIEKMAKKKKKRVCDIKVDGKCVYKTPTKEINYELYDLPSKKTGLKKIVISKTVLHGGKVGSQCKMTTGHKHKGKEEVYIFLKGKGKMKVGKKTYKVKKGDLVTIPAGKWHRVITEGERLEFLSVFEKYGKRG